MGEELTSCIGFGLHDKDSRQRVATFNQYHVNVLCSIQSAVLFMILDLNENDALLASVLILFHMNIISCRAFLGD
ncbi:hypothetical protein Plhal304r1_c035g0109251 [Plasmopara halstedii]